MSTLEQTLPPSQQDRRDRDVQFVNEARAEILLLPWLTPPPMRTSMPLAALRARSSAW